MDTSLNTHHNLDLHVEDMLMGCKQISESNAGNNAASPKTELGHRFLTYLRGEFKEEGWKLTADFTALILNNYQALKGSTHWQTVLGCLPILRENLPEFTLSRWECPNALKKTCVEDHCSYHGTLTREQAGRLLQNEPGPVYLCFSSPNSFAKEVTIARKSGLEHETLTFETYATTEDGMLEMHMAVCESACPLTNRPLCNELESISKVPGYAGWIAKSSQTQIDASMTNFYQLYRSSSSPFTATIVMATGEQLVRYRIHCAVDGSGWFAPSGNSEVFVKRSNLEEVIHGLNPDSRPYSADLHLHDLHPDDLASMHSFLYAKIQSLSIGSSYIGTTYQGRISNNNAPDNTSWTYCGMTYLELNACTIESAQALKALVTHFPDVHSISVRDCVLEEDVHSLGSQLISHFPRLKQVRIENSTDKNCTSSLSYAVSKLS